MYKSKLHQLIWFPYRPEQRFIGPLLVVLLLVIASTGILRQVDIFTAFASSNLAGSEAKLMALLFCLCLVACVNAARTDYMSVFIALLPCVVTLLVIAGLSILLAQPTSNPKLAILQSGVSTFATLAVIGRFVQSGGTDLGKLGAWSRRTQRHAQDLARVSTVSSGFSTRRTELVAEVDALAKALREAAPEVLLSELCNEVAERLESFVSRSKITDHEDFQRDLSGGEDALDRSLTMLKPEAL